ncbi:hydrolase glyoxylase [Heyndrickxia shackletonii]|uniref:Hydrolase glyoxylase n=1 Tax=Heyndrickxia shackletonii TaxID=157838 RepID=A0A0Q3TDR3_9BACI|nr:MBL fold metallo-hydrolase [Heyndrickxia shackletonii]KQL52248.1 hydrolase glyoxylase [Heyndrickxia shackletonii]NEZ00267.1 MBL fold metallo-hydrolase [Heyndrickxia shackletonii]
MKVEQISEHIWSLKTWMIIPIHVWLVADENGVTLVDAGIPSMAKGILKTIERIQRGPLQTVLLTHGHSDHVGALNVILKEKNVPVYAHSVEIPYMEGDLPYPRRKKAAQSVSKGITKALPVDKQGNLQSIAGLTPYHTPGHSPGHIAYYHEEDQVLLAGDLFTSKKGQLQKPMAMFTADMEEAVNSSRIIEQLQPKRLEVCHGNSVLQPAGQIQIYIQQMSQNLNLVR